ncbi:MAG: HEAT repeat domain-containing protein, partial [Anaerolineae bacterium]
IGDREAVPALIGALKDEDEDVRRKAAEALEKILGGLRPAAGEKERREQARFLRRAARALYRARRRVEVYRPLQTVLESLEATTARYVDPLSPLPAPPLTRAVRTVGLALALGLLLAALGLVGVLSGAAGKLLQEQAEALLRAYPPGAAALLLALLAALAGFLSRAVERLRKR